MFKFIAILSTLMFVFLIEANAVELRPGLDLLTNTYLVAQADSKVNEFESEELDRWPYTVQVASYVSEQDALKHVDQLKKFDKKAFYFPTFTRGQVWFKVCSGRFAKVEEAENFRKNLVKKTDEPFAIVITLQSTTPNRKTASESTINLAKETTQLPIQKKSDNSLKDLEVKLVKKSDLPNLAKVDKDTAKEMVKAQVVDEPVSKKAAKSLYTLQIASFNKQTEAEAKAKASGTDEVARVQASDVNGKTWYRVYLGEFTSKNEAEAFRAVFLEKNEGSGAFIKKLDK